MVFFLGGLSGSPGGCGSFVDGGANANLPLNAWSHVAVTYDGSALRAYVNGVLTRTITGVGGMIRATPGAPLRVGTSSNGRYFDGLIDEPTVYDRALSTAEIQGIFQAGAAGKCKTQTCATPPPGLLAWYKGEDNLSDSQGANTATAPNGIAYATAMVGKGFSTNGTSTYVQVADSPALRPQSLTAQAWVNLRSNASGYTPVFVFGANSSGLSTYQGHPSAVVCSASGCYSSVSLSVSLNTWYHLSMTYDSGSQTLLLYVNGQQVGARSNVPPPDYDGSPLRIGDSFFKTNGLIDEVQLYNRALSPTEIQEVFAAGSSGHCANCAPLPSPPSAWYKLEGNGADSSPNINNISTTTGTPELALGQVGAAFLFNGGNASFETPAIPALQQLPLTLEAWVNPALRADDNGTGYPSNALSTDDPGNFGMGFGVNVFLTARRW